MYKNLKIGKKLFLGFAALALVSAVAMLFTLYCLRDVGSLSHQMFAGPYISTTEAVGIQNDLNTLGKDLRSAVIAKDMAAYEAQITKTRTSLNARLEKVKSVFGGDPAMITELETAVANLSVEREKVSSQITDGKYEQAGNMILSSYLKAFNIANEKALALYENADLRAHNFDQKATTTANNAVYLSLALLCVTLILAFFMAVICTRAITLPLRMIEAAAREMASGSLDVSIDYDSKDELGVLSESFRTTINGIKNIITDIRYLLGEMANGNFNIKTRAEDNYIKDYAPILLAMRNINRKLSDTLSQISQSSDQVSSGSDQVSSGAQALSQGATEQASSVQELAATVNEISNQVNQTASNAARAKALTDEAGEEVNGSNRQMSDLVNAMQEISTSSKEIGKIIKTIEDIAFQTNILALNAAVEAARAGAAGKGFAVVADEVRNLASKSASASKDTATLIANSLQLVEKGSRIADATARSLSNVVNSTQKVVGIVDLISDATNEQANSIAQVTQGIDQISSVVQTNSATAEQSAAASEELSGQAAMLKDLVGRFTLVNSGTVAASAPPAHHAKGESGVSYAMDLDVSSKY